MDSIPNIGDIQEYIWKGGFGIPIMGSITPFHSILQDNPSTSPPPPNPGQRRPAPSSHWHGNQASKQL